MLCLLFHWEQDTEVAYATHVTILWQNSHLISKAGQKCNPYSDLCNYLKSVIVFPHNRREVGIWSIFNSTIFPIRIIRICMYINYSSFCPTSIVQFIPVSGSCGMCIGGRGEGEGMGVRICAKIFTSLHYLKEKIILCTVGGDIFMPWGKDI